jgi:uncharacterized protein with HEPN domain
MSRDSGRRIDDILNAIDRCQQYVRRLDDDADDLVLMAEDAIERNLQIIGEAANHLPQHVRDAHPEIGWPQIRGFRNILVHQHFGVEPEVVRDVVVTYLPPLAAALKTHTRGSNQDGAQV